MECLDRVISLRSDHANAHYLKGYIHQRETAYELAFEQYQAALRAGTQCTAYLL